MSTEGTRAELNLSLADAISPADELDELLPIYRRRLFDHDLKEQFSAIEKTGEPLALIMIDVDRFGLLNKTYGHPVGDEVLKFVANTIRKITGSKGKCYRYGGEEIAIILPNYTAEEAAALAERARHQICAAELGEQSVHVSASFGVAQIPTHASTASELLKLADLALLDAKNRGRNLVRISGEQGPEARPRPPARKRPDPSILTDAQVEEVRTRHFRYQHATCPRDGSILRIREVKYDDKVTPDLDVTCPSCGLSERILGP